MSGSKFRFLDVISDRPLDDFEETLVDILRTAPKMDPEKGCAAFVFETGDGDGYIRFWNASCADKMLLRGFLDCSVLREGMDLQTPREITDPDYYAEDDFDDDFEDDDNPEVSHGK